MAALPQNKTRATPRWLFVTLAATTSALVALLLGMLVYANSQNEQIKLHRDMVSLQAEVIYLDEVLTMSARMAAFTGDGQWLQRYNDNERRLDQVIEQLLSKELVLGARDFTAFIQATEAANNQLIELERRAFAATASDDLGLARDLLLNDQYLGLKEEYKSGIRQAIDTFNGAVVRERREQRQLQQGLFGLAVLLALVWIAAIVHSYQLHRRQLQLTEERNEAQRQSLHAAKLASIGELAAGVGHEINNPLTILIGNTSLINIELAKETPDQRVIEACLARHDKAANRISKIVNGLRTYARFDTDHFAPMDLATAVSEAVSLFREIYEKNGIRLQVNLPQQMVPVRGNIGRLQQVVVNLVSNAKDAVKDQNEPSIAISVDYDDHGPFIKVADNGPGIPAEIQPKVFNNFFTTKPAGHGTGMGLALVQTIITEHGGQVSMTSSSTGTEFLVQLPALEMEDGGKVEVEQVRQSPEPAAIDARLQGMRVLIVDDEEQIRAFLEHTAAQLGCICEQASDGLEAVKLMERDHHYDCILVDLRMPRMPGMDLLSYIRNRPGDRPFTIVVTGGIATEYSKAKRQELLDLADLYLLKPVEQTELHDALADVAVRLIHREQSLGSAA